MNNYFDLVQSIIEKKNLDAYIYESGDYDGDFLIVDDTKDGEVLEQELESALIQLGEFEQDYNFRYDEAIDYATDDKWAYYDSAFVCDDCGKAYLINEYGKANYFVSDYGITCEDCVHSNPEPYIDWLIDNDDRANTILDDEELNQYGFYKENDYPYENGWYGREDNPKAIARQIRELHPYAQIIFSISGSGSNPFATEFDVYARYDEDEEYEDDDYE